MVVDAFFYMYFVGSGTAAGVGSIVFIAWKIVQRSNNKNKKTKKRGF